MKLKVYAYHGCGTCRKALKFLEAHGVAHEVIPIREQPPTKAALKRALKHAGSIRKLCNTSGQEYRRLGLKDRLPQMSEAEVLDLLAGNGNLIKRPFVVAGRDAWAGFNEADWRVRLGVS